MQQVPLLAEFDERRDAPRVEVERRYSIRLDPCDGRAPITCALLDFSVTGMRLELPDNSADSDPTVTLLQQRANGSLDRLVQAARAAEEL